MCRANIEKNTLYKPNKWRLITNTEAYQLTDSTATKGIVYPYPIKNLPTSIRDKIPRIREAYVSDYITGSLSCDGATVLGELAVGREDGNIEKCYVYLFGISGSAVYFNGPYKPYYSHYVSFSGGIPVDRIFNHVDFKSPPSN